MFYTFFLEASFPFFIIHLRVIYTYCFRIMRKRVPRWRAFFSRLSTIYFLLISSVYSQCNGRIDRIMAIEKTEGYLSSPEFPATYEVGLRCVYELSAPSLSGLVIRVELLVLDISDVYQKSEQCLWDYLIFIIYDREGREHVGARYCGRPQQLPIFNTMQSKMTIMFVSNPQTRHNHTHQGFKLKYNFVPECKLQSTFTTIDNCFYSQSFS